MAIIGNSQCGVLDAPNKDALNLYISLSVEKYLDFYKGNQLPEGGLSFDHFLREVILKDNKEISKAFERPDRKTNENVARLVNTVTKTVALGLSNVGKVDNYSKLSEKFNQQELASIKAATAIYEGEVATSKLRGESIIRAEKNFIESLSSKGAIVNNTGLLHNLIATLELRGGDNKDFFDKYGRLQTVDDILSKDLKEVTRLLEKNKQIEVYYCVLKPEDSSGKVYNPESPKHANRNILATIEAERLSRETTNTIKPNESFNITVWGKYTDEKNKEHFYRLGSLSKESTLSNHFNKIGKDGTEELSKLAAKRNDLISESNPDSVEFITEGEIVQIHNGGYLHKAGDDRGVEHIDPDFKNTTKESDDLHGEDIGKEGSSNPNYQEVYPVLLVVGKEQSINILPSHTAVWRDGKLDMDNYIFTLRAEALNMVKDVTNDRGDLNIKTTQLRYAFKDKQGKFQTAYTVVTNFTKEFFDIFKAEDNKISYKTTEELFEDIKNVFEHISDILYSQKNKQGNQQIAISFVDSNENKIKYDIELVKNKGIQFSIQGQPGSKIMLTNEEIKDVGKLNNFIDKISLELSKHKPYIGRINDKIIRENNENNKEGVLAIIHDFNRSMHQLILSGTIKVSAHEINNSYFSQVGMTIIPKAPFIDESIVEEITENKDTVEVVKKINTPKRRGLSSIKGNLSNKSKSFKSNNPMITKQFITSLHKYTEGKNISREITPSVKKDLVDSIIKLVVVDKETLTSDRYFPGIENEEDFDTIFKNKKENLIPLVFISRAEQLEEELESLPNKNSKTAIQFQKQLDIINLVLTDTSSEEDEYAIYPELDKLIEEAEARIKQLTGIQDIDELADQVDKMQQQQFNDNNYQQYDAFKDCPAQLKLVMLLVDKKDVKGNTLTSTLGLPIIHDINDTYNSLLAVFSKEWKPNLFSDSKKLIELLARQKKQPALQELSSILDQQLKNGNHQLLSILYANANLYLMNHSVMLSDNENIYITAANNNTKFNKIKNDISNKVLPNAERNGMIANERYTAKFFIDLLNLYKSFKVEKDIETNEVTKVGLQSEINAAKDLESFKVIAKDLYTFMDNMGMFPSEFDEEEKWEILFDEDIKKDLSNKLFFSSKGNSYNSMFVPALRKIATVRKEDGNMTVEVDPLLLAPVNETERQANIVRLESEIQTSRAVIESLEVSIFQGNELADPEDVEILESIKADEELLKEQTLKLEAKVEELKKVNSNTGEIDLINFEKLLAEKFSQEEIGEEDKMVSKTLFTNAVTFKSFIEGFQDRVEFASNGSFSLGKEQYQANARHSFLTIAEMKLRKAAKDGVVGIQKNDPFYERAIKMIENIGIEIEKGVKNTYDDAVKLLTGMTDTEWEMKQLLDFFNFTGENHEPRFFGSTYSDKSTTTEINNKLLARHPLTKNNQNKSVFDTGVFTYALELKDDKQGYKLSAPLRKELQLNIEMELKRIINTFKMSFVLNQDNSEVLHSIYHLTGENNKLKQGMGGVFVIHPLLNEVLFSSKNIIFLESLLEANKDNDVIELKGVEELINELIEKQEEVMNGFAKKKYEFLEKSGIIKNGKFAYEETIKKKSKRESSVDQSIVQRITDSNDIKKLIYGYSFAQHINYGMMYSLYGDTAQNQKGEIKYVEAVKEFTWIGKDGLPITYEVELMDFTGKNDEMFEKTAKEAVKRNAALLGSGHIGLTYKPFVNVSHIKDMSISSNQFGLYDAILSIENFFGEKAADSYGDGKNGKKSGEMTDAQGINTVKNHLDNRLSVGDISLEQYFTSLAQYSPRHFNYLMGENFQKTATDKPSRYFTKSFLGKENAEYFEKYINTNTGEPTKALEDLLNSDATKSNVIFNPEKPLMRYDLFESLPWYLKQHYLKESTYVIFEGMSEDSSKLNRLLDIMYQNNIDRFTFKSGVKMGANRPQPLLVKDNEDKDVLNTGFFDNNLHLIPTDVYLKQLETEYKEDKVSMSQSTQQETLVIADTAPDIGFKVNGDTITGEELKKEFIRLNKERKDEKLRELFDKFDINIPAYFTKDGSEPKILFTDKTVGLIVKEIKKMVMANNNGQIDEQLESILKLNDEGNNLLSYINFHGGSNKVEQQITAMFSKAIIRDKLPGKGLIQGSEFVLQLLDMFDEKDEDVEIAKLGKKGKISTLGEYTGKFKGKAQNMQIISVDGKTRTKLNNHILVWVDDKGIETFLDEKDDKGNMKHLDKITKYNNAIIALTDPKLSQEERAPFIELLNNNFRVEPAEIIIPFIFSYTNKQGQKVKLSINDFTTTDKDGNRILDTTKVSPELLKIIGLRIPYQSVASGSIYKIVGFTPQEMGDLVLVPAEIAVQMGADYDVDKLYAQTKHVKYSDGKISAYKKGSVTQEEIDAIFSSEKNDEELTQYLLNHPATKNIEELKLKIQASTSTNIKDLKLIEKEKQYIVAGENKLKEIESQWIAKKKEQIRKNLESKSKNKVTENELFDLKAAVYQSPFVFFNLIKPLGTDDIDEGIDLKERITGTDADRFGGIANPEFQRYVFFSNQGGKQGLGIAVTSSLFLANAQNCNAYSKDMGLLVTAEDGSIYHDSFDETNSTTNEYLNQKKLILELKEEIKSLESKPDKDSKDIERLRELKKLTQYSESIYYKNIYDESTDSYVYVPKGANEGLGRWDKIYGLSGIPISNIFSQWINVFVDNAKDQQMLRAGLTPANTGVAMYLTVLGLEPKYITLLLSQPIIVDYYTMIGDNENIFNPTFKSRSAKDTEVLKALIEKYTYLTPKNGSDVSKILREIQDQKIALPKLGEDGFKMTSEGVFLLDDKGRKIRTGKFPTNSLCGMLDNYYNISEKDVVAFKEARFGNFMLMGQMQLIILNHLVSTIIPRATQIQQINNATRFNRKNLSKNLFENLADEEDVAAFDEDFEHFFERFRNNTVAGIYLDLPKIINTIFMRGEIETNTGETIKANLFSYDRPAYKYVIDKLKAVMNKKHLNSESLEKINRQLKQYVWSYLFSDDYDMIFKDVVGNSNNPEILKAFNKLRSMYKMKDENDNLLWGKEPEYLIKMLDEKRIATKVQTQNAGKEGKRFKTELFDTVFTMYSTKETKTEDIENSWNNMFHVGVEAENLTAIQKAERDFATKLMFYTLLFSNKEYSNNSLIRYMPKHYLQHLNVADKFSELLKRIDNEETFAEFVDQYVRNNVGEVKSFNKIYKDGKGTNKIVEQDHLSTELPKLSNNTLSLKPIYGLVNGEGINSTAFGAKNITINLSADDSNYEIVENLEPDSYVSIKFNGFNQPSLYKVMQTRKGEIGIEVKLLRIDTLGNKYENEYLFGRNSLTSKFTGNTLRLNDQDKSSDLKTKLETIDSTLVSDNFTIKNIVNYLRAKNLGLDGKPNISLFGLANKIFGAIDQDYLKAINFKFNFDDNADATRGMYSRSNNTITINLANFVNIDGKIDETKLKEILIHEILHAVSVEFIGKGRANELTDPNEKAEYIKFITIYNTFLDDYKDSHKGIAKYEYSYGDDLVITDVELGFRILDKIEEFENGLIKIDFTKQDTLFQYSHTLIDNFDTLYPTDNAVQKELRIAKLVELNNFLQVHFFNNQVINTGYYAEKLEQQFYAVSSPEEFLVSMLSSEKAIKFVDSINQSSDNKSNNLINKISGFVSSAYQSVLKWLENLFDLKSAKTIDTFESIFNIIRYDAAKNKENYIETIVKDYVEQSPKFVAEIEQEYLEKLAKRARNVIDNPGSYVEVFEDLFETALQPDNIDDNKLATNALFENMGDDLNDMINLVKEMKGITDRDVEETIEKLDINKECN
jgi:hypothetical protein